MAVTFSTLKLKSLTNFTGNSSYLLYNGESLNSYQNINTPYEATYQINFQNHITTYTHYISTASSAVVSAISTEYVGKYKIYNFNYDLDKPVKVQISVGTAINFLCLNANRGFKTNVKNAENLINYSYDYENIKNADGSVFASGTWNEQPSLIFVPTAGTNGHIRFSVKFYDKYIISPPA